MDEWLSLAASYLTVIANTAITVPKPGLPVQACGGISTGFYGPVNSGVARRQNKAAVLTLRTPSLRMN
jgi:hypothetical protein